MTTSQSPAAANLPALADDEVKIQYIDGELCVVRKFKGTKSLPLEVKFAFKPLSFDDLLAESEATPNESAADADPSSPATQRKVFEEHCRLVAKHLRLWSLVGKDQKMIPVNDANAIRKDVPALVVSEIVLAIRESATPDMKTGLSPVDDLAKKSPPPSDSH